MPHVIIEHSQPLTDSHNLTDLSVQISKAMQETGLFPLAGTRVRCHSVTHYSIADNDPKNNFVHINLRIGVGRSDQQQKIAADSVLDAAKCFFADIIDSGYFALSLELTELPEILNLKVNAIHKRLK